MSRFVKYVLITFVADIVLFLLIMIPAFTCQAYDCLGPAIMGFILIGLTLLVQLIVGLVFLNKANKREIGQAILLITGLFLLIGFSVCSLN